MTSRAGSVVYTKAYVVQGDYGVGWEDVTEEETRPEGLARLREYRENSPEFPHRLILRRERVTRVEVEQVTTLGET